MKDKWPDTCTVVPLFKGYPLEMSPMISGVDSNEGERVMQRKNNPAKLVMKLSDQTSFAFVKRTIL